MTPFEWLKCITVTKQPWDTFTDEDKEGFNHFIINKALSFNKDYIQVVEIAMLYPMPNEKLYQFYCNMLPKKPIWNKWIKSNVSYNEEEIKQLAHYFECGTREVKDFVNLLDSQEKFIILSELKGVEDKPKKKKKNDKKQGNL